MPARSSCHGPRISCCRSGQRYVDPRDKRAYWRQPSKFSVSERYVSAFRRFGFRLCLYAALPPPDLRFDSARVAGRYAGETPQTKEIESQEKANSTCDACRAGCPAASRYCKRLASCAFISFQYLVISNSTRCRSWRRRRRLC